MRFNFVENKMRTPYESRRVLSSLKTRCFTILGILFCFIGSADIILSIIELFQGRTNAYHYQESQGGLKIENPLWPFSGKGFWVGLVLLVTGAVGVLASRERTYPSSIGFTVLSSVSTILSFYLIITCIIPIQYSTKYSDSTRPRWQSKELILNLFLIAIGGFGIIVGVISILVGSVLAGCWKDQRNLHRFLYSDDPIRLL